MNTLLLEQHFARTGVEPARGPDLPLTLAGQYWSDRLLHSLQTVLTFSTGPDTQAGPSRKTPQTSRKGG